MHNLQKSLQNKLNLNQKKLGDNDSFSSVIAKGNELKKQKYKSVNITETNNRASFYKLSTKENIEKTIYAKIKIKNQNNLNFTLYNQQRKIFNKNELVTFPKLNSEVGKNKIQHKFDLNKHNFLNYEEMENLKRENLIKTTTSILKNFKENVNLTSIKSNTNIKCVESQNIIKIDKCNYVEDRDIIKSIPIGNTKNIAYNVFNNKSDIITKSQKEKFILGNLRGNVREKRQNYECLSAIKIDKFKNNRNASINYIITCF